MNRVRSSFWQFIIIIILACTYVAAARLGLLLALPPGYATSFWPPSGIAVAAVLFFGSGVWPGIFIGAFIANLLTTTGQPSVTLFVSSGIAIGSTLQALAVAYLINRYANGVNFFKSHKSVFSYVICTLAGSLIAATVGLIYLSISNLVTIGSIGTNWLTWWLGDSVGVFIFTSFIVTFIKTFDSDELYHQFLEATQILIYIALIAILCFWDWIGDGYPIEYLFIPFLIWALFRFEPYYCFVLLILISCVAVWGTTRGFGPFATVSVNESLILLQAFMGVFAIGSLFMISILDELESTYLKMEEYNKMLQEQLATASHTKEMSIITEKAMSNLKSRLITSSPVKGNHKRNFVDFNGLVIGFTNLAYLNRQSIETAFKLNLSKHLDPKIGLVEISTVDFSRALILLLDNAFDSVIQTENEAGKDFLPEVSIDTLDLGSKVSIIVRDNGKPANQEEIKDRLNECYNLIVGKLKGEFKLLQDNNFSECQIIFPKFKIS